MSLEHGFGLNQTSCCTIRQARVSRFQRFQFKLELENELAVVATSEEEVEGLDVLGDTTLSNVRFDLCQRDVQRSHETIVGEMIPAGGSCLGLGLYRSSTIFSPDVGAAANGTVTVTFCMKQTGQ